MTVSYLPPNLMHIMDQRIVYAVTTLRIVDTLSWPKVFSDHSNSLRIVDTELRNLSACVA
jgi:hypothetical protein